jgi:hypothetical protein
LGPITKTVKVKSSLSDQSRTRLVADAEVIIQGEHHRVPVSIGDRSNMKYEVIIGRDVLRRCQCLIDPNLDEE